MGWQETTTIRLGRFRSERLGNERRVWVQPPAGGAGVEGAGLSVFLDGEYYLTHLRAPSTMHALQVSGRLPPMWSVFVAAGPQERRWPESFCNDKFVGFLVDELLPDLAATLGVAGERWLTGVSLTGLSAAHAALARPGTFARVLCHSGSFWWQDCALTGRMATFDPGDTRFRITVGEEETATDVDHGDGLVQVHAQIDGCERMRDALTTAGFEVSYEVYAGGHTMATWRRELADDLVKLAAL